MLRLAMMLSPIIGSTFMGIGVLVALVTGNDTSQPIVAAAVIGLAFSIPVTWFVAYRISRRWLKSCRRAMTANR